MQTIPERLLPVSKVDEWYRPFPGDNLSGDREDTPVVEGKRKGVSEEVGRV